MAPDFLGTDPLDEIIVNIALGVEVFLLISKVTSLSNSGYEKLLAFIFPLFLKLISWDTIEIAISSGVTAPISSPMGELTLSKISLD